MSIHAAVLYILTDASWLALGFKLIIIDCVLEFVAEKCTEAGILFSMYAKQCVWTYCDSALSFITLTSLMYRCRVKFGTSLLQ